MISCGACTSSGELDSGKSELGTCLSVIGEPGGALGPSREQRLWGGPREWTSAQKPSCDHQQQESRRAKETITLVPEQSDSLYDTINILYPDYLEGHT